MSEKVLREVLYNKTKTIDLMDKFDSVDANSKRKYDVLELVSLFYIFHNDEAYTVTLFVKRKPIGEEIIDSDLTFTELKRNIMGHFYTVGYKSDYEVINELCSQLESDGLQVGAELEYTFAVPIKFNAQNSRNRCGYGNEYCGDELVYEGTLYGETTDYMFVGARISKV